MRAKSTLLLTFLGALGGACQPAPAAHARVTVTPPAQPAPPAPPANEPAPAALAETLTEADQAFVSQLSATRGGQFAVDRQVWDLQQAILLYTQFLERAAGHPEFEPAIRKSRERIADAKATIAVLLEWSKTDGETPPAETE